MNFHVPHTKTWEKGEDIYVTDSTCLCSPTSTLEHHLQSNKDVPTSAPLFAYESGDGLWALMRQSWFLACCNTIWEKDGLSLIKGHGFHIGGMTHLLLLGVDLWVVMVQGHWSSEAFLSYWQKCEEFLSLFLGFSFQLHQSILSTMNSFKARLTV